MINPNIGSGRELKLHNIACSGNYRPQLTITWGIIDIGLIRQDANNFGIAWTLNPSFLKPPGRFLDLCKVTLDGDYRQNCNIPHVFKIFNNISIKHVLPEKRYVWLYLPHRGSIGIRFPTLKVGDVDKIITFLLSVFEIPRHYAP